MSSHNKKLHIPTAAMDGDYGMERVVRTEKQNGNIECLKLLIASDTTLTPVTGKDLHTGAPDENEKVWVKPFFYKIRRPY